jgi:DNA-binding transcriptional MerR regulator
MAERLVPTGDAAKAVGVDIRTLQRWVKNKIIKPHGYTAGGHMRWDVDRLRQELRDLQQRDE